MTEVSDLSDLIDPSTGDIGNDNDDEVMDDDAELVMMIEVM